MRVSEKVSHLIEKGKGALASHKPNPPNVIGFPTCDTGLFATWKTQSLSFLERQFSSTSPYYIEFQDEVQRPHRGSISTGIGVLGAVR